MIDPNEFTKSNGHYNGYKGNRNFFRDTSSNTVLTENDTAWFYSGNAGAATEGDVETWMDESNVVLSDHFSAAFPNIEDGISCSGKKRRRHYTKSKPYRQKHPLCDTTTTLLLVLCIFLTLTLGVLIVTLDPYRNTINIAGSNSSSAALDTTTTTSQPSSPTLPQIPESANSTSLPIPTMAPVIATNSPTLSYKTIVPTRNPTSKPTFTPTQRPTASVPRMPTLNLDEEQHWKAPSDEAVNNTNPANNNDKVPSLSMGPMVGHTTHDSVTLWAYHDEFASDAMEVLLYDYGSDALLQKVNFVSPSRKGRNNAKTIHGLQPSTSYKYGIHIRGERVGKGSFTTAPKSNNNNNGTRFDYVLASCMNYRQYKNQMVWDVMAQKLGKYPDFSILAGDTVYLQEGVDVTKENGVNFDRLWFRNWEQRNQPNFAKFVRNVPTYSTWNDHEYGANNANKDQKGKSNSLKAWESLWPNPGYGDEDTDDGVYYSYYWGDVHYIVTDDHWHRDPSQNNRLGTKQTEWIENELLHSKGTFKVIVIGSDIMERGWSSDLYNIGDIVRENRINGVVFHAGDIHRNEYKEMVTGGFPYPVKQITSSGIAKVWRRPFVHIRVDTGVDDPSMTAFFYGASSTAESTTWSNDPSLRCSSIEGIDRTKEHMCTETIRLSDVTVPSR